MNTPSRKEMACGHDRGTHSTATVIPEGDLVKTFLFLIAFVATSFAGTITTIAGMGTLGYAGDSGQAAVAQVADPFGVVVDSHGNLFIADGSNHVIRKVDTAGIITTVAGTGTAGFTSDSGKALDIAMSYPSGLAIDSLDNVYVSDRQNNRVRKLTPQGTMVTVAGGGGMCQANATQAKQACLYSPYGVAIDRKGNLFIADRNNGLVRKVTPQGTIATVAGGGPAAYPLSDGGRAIDASLTTPVGVTEDKAGNLFIAEDGTSHVRKVDTNGIITTFAGLANSSGYNGDDVPATQAKLYFPVSVYSSPQGNLYIVDSYNQRIRKVDTAGNITTVAGSGEMGYSADSVEAISASLYFPQAVFVDRHGDLIIADKFNQRVRKVTGVEPPFVPVVPILAPRLAHKRSSAPVRFWSLNGRLVKPQ